ncbi:hypothetical protein Bra3105_09445 [Brachybacterium halotolerans subsp. kimchii]|uniref:hypothetical protein n=1 Tax=Brachybacterium halotolerans TaxID=2795215 RepID=UPI001E3DAFF4|nr:hypothetical protein [Brachybacterium halotolerans]UEJ81091.1 hypothetical protein Bra3105_09445 [Brachybacterium halotolerans subsp. kimchii]
MTAPRSASSGTGAAHPGDGARPGDAARPGGAGESVPDLSAVPVQVPSLARLREALRGPETPLPPPRGIREAAVRVRDLVHAERFAEALYVAERFRDAPGPPSERLELLRAQLMAALAAIEEQGPHEGLAAQGVFTAHDGRAGQGATTSPQDLIAVQELVRDMVRTIEEAGAPEQAGATLEVLGAHLRRLAAAPPDTSAAAAPARVVGPVSSRPGPAASSSAAPAASRASAASPSGSGSGAHGRRRRRRDGGEIPSGLLAVVGCLELPRPSAVDVEQRALREALVALPELQVPLVDDPGPLLAVRYAQDLEAIGWLPEATRLALDVLDEASRLEAREGGFADATRVAVSAHAVLARTLLEENPLAAVGHALAALEGLREVEDSPLRVGLITELLRALVRCDLQDQATFTAGRLASLTRTLPHDEQRIEPLLAVGAQRVAARRYDGAMVALSEVQSLSAQLRDRRSRLEATRLLARLHHEQGQGLEALDQLRLAAADARWVADDLFTPLAERPRFIRAELDAEALVLRHALDLGRPTEAAAASREVVRRVRSERGTGSLPDALLWDHEADARIGAMIAEGLRAAAELRAVADAGDRHAGAPGGTGGTGGADGTRRTGGAGEAAAKTRTPYEKARREAMATLERVPEGHEARASYWGAYLEDRHAAMLAARGDRSRALKAARRAERAWRQLGREDEAVRIAEEIAHWSSGGAPRHAGPSLPSDPH